MLTNIKEFFKPETIDQALELLTEKSNSRVLAGGVVLSKALGESTDYLIDLNSLPYNYFRISSNEIRIGALTKINEIYRSRDLADLKAGEFLQTVAGHVASEQIRNMASIGGAIFARHYWSDIIPTLLVLDTELEFKNRDGEFTATLEEFLDVSNIDRFKDSILTELVIREPGNGYHFWFEKFCRTKVDIAIVNIAVVYLIDSDDRFQDFRISTGGTESIISRKKGVEKYLTGKKKYSSNLEKASDLLLENVKPVGDLRGSEGYKKKLLKTLFLESFNRG